MKNWEKFEKELVAANGYIGIVDGKIVQCYGPYCERCVFKSESCGEKRIKWLYSESEPELTAREKAFLDEIECNSPFVARDRSGALYMYPLFCPEKTSINWKPTNCGNYIQLNTELFSFIRWEDEKPWTLSNLKKLKVKEGE